MKKHAFLLGVYKNPDYVEELIRQLDSAQSNIYIHINKLYVNDFENLKLKYAAKNNVVFTESVVVKWGGLGFLNSALIMMRDALKDEENQVFHLISGQDVICKPIEDILSFFEDNEKSYLAYRPLPENRSHYYDYYWFNDLIDVREGKRFSGIPTRLRNFQMKHQIKRKPLNFEQPYFGSCWFSLQRDALDYLYATICDKSNGFYKRLKYTFAPDEMIFQSILINAKRFDIVNNNLRYVRWSPNNNGSPDLLIEKDYDEVRCSDCIFARKIDPLLSRGLINQFHKNKFQS